MSSTHTFVSPTSSRLIILVPRPMPLKEPPRRHPCAPRTASSSSERIGSERRCWRSATQSAASLHSSMSSSRDDTVTSRRQDSATSSILIMSIVPRLLHLLPPLLWLFIRGALWGVGGLYDGLTIKAPDSTHTREDHNMFELQNISRSTKCCIKGTRAT
mmetsp:Transcript_39793/g.73359  ORF Transcript_39793/g.73359 Transcript_39793/m.73359 type:complete len:159 (-) Transcript_39793:242-718(-)